MSQLHDYDHYKENFKTDTGLKADNNIGLYMQYLQLVMLDQQKGRAKCDERLLEKILESHYELTRELHKQNQIINRLLEQIADAASLINPPEPKDSTREPKDSTPKRPLFNSNHDTSRFL